MTRLSDQPLQVSPCHCRTLATPCEQGGCQLDASHRSTDPYLLIGDPQLPYGIPTELHVLSEPLITTLEGKPATFVQCSCGLTFETTFASDPACPLAGVDFDYREAVERAALIRSAAISRLRAIGKTDAELLRRAVA